MLTALQSDQSNCCCFHTEMAVFIHLIYSAYINLIRKEVQHRYRTPFHSKVDVTLFAFGKHFFLARCSALPCSLRAVLQEKKGKVSTFLSRLHLHGLICSRRAGPDGLSLLGPLRFAARPTACQQIRYREYWQIWLSHEAAAEQCSQLPGAHAERQHPAVGVTLFVLQFGLQSASSHNLHFSTKGVCSGSVGNTSPYTDEINSKEQKKICHVFSFPFHSTSLAAEQFVDWNVAWILIDCSCHLHLLSPPASHIEAWPASKPASQSLRWKPPCTHVYIPPTDSQNNNFGSLPPPAWKAATQISKVTYNSIEGSCMPILKNNCVPIRERILSGVNMSFLSLWKKRLSSSLLIRFQKLIIFFHIIILTSKEITLNYVYRAGGDAEMPKYDSLRGVALYISVNRF